MIAACRTHPQRASRDLGSSAQNSQEAEFTEGEQFERVRLHSTDALEIAQIFQGLIEASRNPLNSPACGGVFLENPPRRHVCPDAPSNTLLLVGSMDDIEQMKQIIQRIEILEKRKDSM